MNWKDVTFGQLFGAALAVALLVLFSLILLFGNPNNRMTWVGLYVVSALVTGTTFWVINPLEKQGFTWSRLGIQLGGAAAIGAGFMTLANQFTPPPQASAQVISLDRIDEAIRQRPTFRVTETYSNMAERPFLIPANGTPTKVLVQFKEGENTANFELEWIEPPQGKTRAATFKVDRNGLIVNFSITDKER